MASSARHKRSAEKHTRAHRDDVNGHQAKKPRFDIRNPSALAPDDVEDDAVLEADVIGSRGQQVRRSAVNIDGYDSDSDNDNFDARATAKAKADKRAKNKDEEQDDMFADLEEEFKDGDDSEGEAGRRGGKKKAVRFLNEDEIEGQIKTSRGGGHVSADFRLDGKGKKTQEAESSSDSEVDDAVRADTGDLDDEIGAGGKKIHAPRLDAFNMRDEQEEGCFDDQGNFVRKAVDPDAVHDQWMDGISKKEIKKAKEAAEKRDEERRKRNLEDDSKSDVDILKNLIPLLDRGETVLEALARLGRDKSKDKKPKWQAKHKNKKQNDDIGDVEMSEKDAAEVKWRHNVEAITAAADLLLTRGQAEIYDAEKDLLIRQYNRQAESPWVDAPIENDAADKMWEYKWTDDRDGGNINGPYNGTTMQQWNDAGYFGEGVVFRQVGSIGDGSWTHVLQF